MTSGNVNVAKNHSTLDLQPVYRFTKKLNIAILCAVYAFVLLDSNLSWDITTSSVYLLVLSLLLIIICWTQNSCIRYFILLEGKVGECLGFKSEALESTRFALLEPKCRITMLGCWLVFTPISSENKHIYEWLWFGKHIAVFVPKYFLSSRDYKGLCRHLIWHSRV